MQTTLKSLARWGLRGQLAETARVGILDSSFNPPTLAHITMMEEAAQHLQLDCMIMLLSVRNADKGLMSDVEQEHRTNMMRLVGENWSASACEVCIVDQPLFVEKITLLQEYWDREHDSITPLFFMLMGFDTIIRVVDPKYYGEDLHTRDEAMMHLMKHLERIVCFQRGSDLESTGIDFMDDKIIWLPEPGHDISSTVCRQQLRDSGTCDAIPEYILDYITEHSLYNENS